MHPTSTYWCLIWGSAFLVADTSSPYSAINPKLLPDPRFDPEEWIYESTLSYHLQQIHKWPCEGHGHKFQLFPHQRFYVPGAFLKLCEVSKYASYWYTARELMLLRWKAQEIDRSQLNHYSNFFACISKKQQIRCWKDINTGVLQH